jgi:ribosome recycling factor
LFNDPHFVKELERFIEKNRLSIATAHTRHQLRLALSRLKEKVRQKPVRHFQIPSI